MNILDRVRGKNFILGLTMATALFASHAVAQAQVKILPLGDSITKGIIGSTDLAGYRNDLADSLTAESVNFTFVGSVTSDAGGNHEGHDGFRADQILANINGYLTSNSPDVILLHTGTNDISDNQTIQSTRDEISSIIDAISAFDANIKIVLASLIPRDDSDDQDTSNLNTLLYGVFLERRDAGVQIFYAGTNEVFKANPNFIADYLADNVHPNDSGYAIIAGVFFNSIMNALTNTDLTVSDNFERTNLGVVWGSDPENVIVNGNMINSAASGDWLYLAVFKGITNLSKASMKWAASTDAVGLELSGLAVMLDSADPTAANGYVITARTGKDQIRLWQVQNGALTTEVDRVDYLLSDPAPGDVLTVQISTDGSGHRFEVFVNGQSYGTLVDPNFLQGAGQTLYSGLLLHGNQNNDIAEFSAEGGGDFDPPAQIQDLAVTSTTTTSASLTWTATGGNGTEGIAASYDMRYSATNITNDTEFNAAALVPNLPNPAPVGTQETIIILGLQPGTAYFFAIKAVDGSGNKSLLSNVATTTTGAGEAVNDDFNSPPLSGNWVHDGSFAIVNNELTNTSTDQGVWNLAVYTAETNALEVAFKWGAGADADGIDQGGIAMMLDAPTTSANGYVITRRPAANQIRLWRVIGGVGPQSPIVEIPILSAPTAGSEFRVVASSDASGNHFTIFIDGQEDITITDPQPVFIDPTSAGGLYAGVMLAGGRNNNVDDFQMLLSPNQLTLVSGNNQTGAVGKPLPQPIVVKLLDGANQPVEGEDVLFDITGGGGSLSDPSGSVVIEAESATLSGGMVAVNDAAASQGKYIEIPEGQGVQTGIATIPFEVPSTGNYHIWGRAIATNSNSDVFFVQIDGGPEFFWDVGQRSDNFKDWEWDAVTNRGSGGAKNPEVDPVVVNLVAGSHLLTIKEGKDGTKLDQVLFTLDPNFIPSGIMSIGSQFVARTDVNGEASATWTLGTTLGFNSARATFAGITREFIATGTPGAPAEIAKVAGENQNALPGQQLANPLVVELRDEFGNVIPSHETNWSVTQGNGTLGASSPIFTDGSGQAQNTLTLSTDTPTTLVQVTAPDYSGPDVIFSMNATAGNADKIEKYAQDSGDNQSGTSSRPLAKPFKVFVSDAVGSPVGGYNVTFTVTGGGGRFGSTSQTTVATNSQGVASATLTLGPEAGATNTVQAVTSLNGSPVTFSATAAIPQTFENLSPLTYTGTVNSSVDSIAVRVKDSLNQPLPGYPVVFSIQAGGGKLNGSLNPVQVSTNASGIAKVEWRLGSSEGQGNNKLRAAAVFAGKDIAGSPFNYTASAAVGAAANLVKISGNDQSGVVQTPLSQPFVVRVTDSGGNPVFDWPVKFTVETGGGNFGGSSSISAATNSSGLASATLTLGSSSGSSSNPFNNRVRVEADNNGPLNGSPQTFRASAVATDASRLLLVSGQNQTGEAGIALTQSIQVKVADNQQNGIAGHPVTLRVTKGGGTINGTGTGDTEKTINTNSAGVVSVTWYLGGALGADAQELSVSANDGINNLIGSPLTISATATTGPADPSASTVTSDKGQLPADGQSIATITVTLKDKFDNPIPGKAVTITASGSNNDIDQPLTLTDASGQVQGTISSTRAEMKSISARNITDEINLSSATDVQFSAIAADEIEMFGGNNQTANVGTAAERPLEVLILDDNNNPVPGVDILFVVTAGGGYIVNGFNTGQADALASFTVTAATGGDGIARGYWILGPDPGTNRAEVRATGLSGSPISFTATGVANAATKVRLHSGNNQVNRIAGSVLPQPLRVLATDANGKPVIGVPVDFRVTVGGGSLSEENVLTDFRGLAETELTLGPAVGSNKVEATSSGLSGSPVNYEFQSVVGPAALIAFHSGYGGKAQVGTGFPISIMITDVNGNAVSGVHSVFQVLQGEATITTQDNVTNESGISVAIINLPNTVGEVVVRATSNDLPEFYKDFIITAEAGPGSSIVELGGNGQEGTVGRELVYPLNVRVTDLFGNPVEGYPVQWIVTEGSGSLATSPTTFTDENGESRNILTLATQVGLNRVWAIALGRNIEFDATGVTNNFPLFQGLTDRSVVEGSELQFQVTATDLDQDPLTYEVQNLPLGASFNAASRTFSWTPENDQAEEYEVTFIARDNKGGLDAETITVEVRNENNPPVIASFQPAELQLTHTVDDTIQFSVNVTDPENDPLSYTWKANGNTVSTSFQWEFRPLDNFGGSYVITVEVTDGEHTVTMEWLLDAVTSVELASFTAVASGFDGVQISWITSREVDNLGFNVLRSETRDGTYVQINEKLIPSNSKSGYLFVDKDVVSGSRYYYMLEDVSLSGLKTQNGPITVDISQPETFELSQNFPNPFNPETKIRYQLPAAQEVSVTIFDILGREVRSLVNERKESGFHVATWDARDNQGRRVSSGIYYYRILAGDFHQTKKMLLMK